MKKVIRLSESDLVKLVKRVIKEQTWSVDIGGNQSIDVGTRNDLGKVVDNKSSEGKINANWDKFFQIIQTVGNPQITHADYNGKKFTNISWRPYERLFTVSISNDREIILLTSSPHKSAKYTENPEEIVKNMINWWKDKGYQVNDSESNVKQVLISFDNPEAIASDLKSFFKSFPVE